MPTISMFYGIVIRMYNNNEHNPPHFHAFYQGKTRFLIWMATCWKVKCLELKPN